MIADDTINLARNFIKAILKAKKLLQIYPSNNVIYLAAIDEAYSTARQYLDLHGDLTLQIKPDEILVDSEQIYESPGKTDNMALFFFKEGIREIKFMEVMSKTELEDLLRFMGIDYDRDDSVSDFVSDVWAAELQGIKFTIDELIFSEDDGMDPSLSANFQARQAPSPEARAEAAGSLVLEIGSQGTGSAEENAILDAYNDALAGNEVVLPSSSELTTEERGLIVAEMNRDASEKSSQLAHILIGMILKAEGSAEAGQIAASIEHLILYSLRRGDLEAVLAIFRGIDEMPPEKRQLDYIDAQVARIRSYCCSNQPMSILGQTLDGVKDFNEETLHEYAAYLGNESIGPFISLLEHLQQIHARRLVNNILIRLGKDNVGHLAARLKDPTWYVVRNMVYILRNIGDSSTLADILAVARHEHPRVRLEVVKALNDLKSVSALEALKDYFDDPDFTVRLSAVTVIGGMARDNSGARQFALDAISAKIKSRGFDERDFREKKSFHETLASFRDKDSDEYMMQVLAKKRILGGRKYLEARACAAYYLGLAGNKKAIPILDRASRAPEPLLREHAAAALQRLRHE
jgi:HEAT repeat protein